MQAAEDHNSSNQEEVSIVCIYIGENCNAFFCFSSVRRQRSSNVIIHVLPRVEKKLSFSSSLSNIVENMSVKPLIAFCLHHSLR